MTARGSSLIEVMVVISILGIITALAVPNLQPLAQSSRLQATTEQVATFVDTARRRAFNEGRCYRVRATSVTNLVMEARLRSDCVNLGTSAGEWSAALQSLRTDGVNLALLSLTTSAADGANNRLVFRPSGRLHGDGDLVANDGAVIRLEVPGGDDKRTVVVTGVGQVCARADRTSFPVVAAALFRCVP